MEFLTGKTANLTGRTAWCRSKYDNPPPNSGHSPQPSNPNLPFFEYMGEGSASAYACKHEGWAESAHINYPDRVARAFGEHQYEPRGGVDYDIYVCYEHIGD